MSSFNPSKDIPDQAGKVFFITGGTAGLGLGAIKNLAAHSPSAIYFTGRREAPASTLIDSLSKSHPAVKVSFIKCDNASLASVKAAAAKFLAASDRLDVLMCNAGVMAVPPATTEDGYEVQFQTNHLAHALFMKLFTPILEKTSETHGDARVVSLSSLAYEQAPPQGIDFATLKSPQEKLGKIIPGPTWSRYGQSKLSNMLYPAQYAKANPTISTVAVHPGVIKTDMLSGAPFLTKLPVLLLNIGKITPVEQGPYNQLWAATVAKEKLTIGEYYEPVGKLAQRGTKQAKNEKLAEELWTWTQKELEAHAV